MGQGESRSLPRITRVHFQEDAVVATAAAPVRVLESSVARRRRLESPNNRGPERRALEVAGREGPTIADNVACCLCASSAQAAKPAHRPSFGWMPKESSATQEMPSEKSSRPDDDSRVGVKQSRPVCSGAHKADEPGGGGGAKGAVPSDNLMLASSTRQRARRLMGVREKGCHKARPTLDSSEQLELPPSLLHQEKQKQQQKQQSHRPPPVSVQQAALASESALSERPGGQTTTSESETAVEVRDGRAAAAAPGGELGASRGPGVGTTTTSNKNNKTNSSPKPAGEPNSISTNAPEEAGGAKVLDGTEQQLQLEQQQHQGQEHLGHERRVSEKLEPEVGKVQTRRTTNTSTSTTTAQDNTLLPRRLAWNELAAKYGRMARKGELLVPSPSPPSDDGQPQQPHQSRLRPPARRRLRDSCFCHLACALLQSLFPLLGALRDYSLPGDLLADLAAGFTVAILHIPQGMAYGLLSGVEPIYGLYVSFVPVLVMALMSKSRHASYGTFAIISMLLVNTIHSVRATLALEAAAAAAAGAATTTTATTTPNVIINNHQKQQQQQHLLQVDAAMAANVPTNIEILACVCLVCGLVHVTMSLARLGVLSLMFSDQLISSFTTAGAVHVLTSQLAGLCDLQLAPLESELFKCLHIWWQVGRALTLGEFNHTTGALSLASLAFLLLLKELVEPRLRKRLKWLTCLPSELLLMALVTLASSQLQLEARHQVRIVGTVPSGLPEARVPRLELVPYVLRDSISIALITFAMNLSIAQVYAKKFRYELNANQELFALGTANILSSFFSCFPCATSLSRSSIQANLNVKSQLASLFSCCLVILIVCHFAHILHHLPKSTLSCIIVVALKGILLQARDLYDNWRLSKLDALVWLATFLAVLALGVTYGLVLGIAASIFMIFLRLLTPNHSVLARLPGTDIFVDRDAFLHCEEFPGVKIFRFNSALCYLNRAQLKSKIHKLLPSVFAPTGFRAICAQFHARQVAQQQQQQLGAGDLPATERRAVSHLIIDCSALSYCDYSGAGALVELVEDLEAQKVAVYLAACPLKLVDMLAKIQGERDILARNVYPTISDALGQASYLRDAGELPPAILLQSQEKPSKSSDSSFTSNSFDGPPPPPPAPPGHGSEKRPRIQFAPKPMKLGF